MRPLLLAAALIIAVLTTVFFTQQRVTEPQQASGSIFFKKVPSSAPQSAQPAPEQIQDEAAAAADGHDHEGELPAELEEYIESQRLPASEIPVVVHGDGTATAYTENQWSTVMMMVIDEDGTRRMVERQIKPDGTLV
ncbi:MAG: hypothetical protein VW258_10100, partial [Thalassolituus sp.]